MPPRRAPARSWPAASTSFPRRGTRRTGRSPTTPRGRRSPGRVPLSSWGCVPKVGMPGGVGVVLAPRDRDPANHASRQCERYFPFPHPPTRNSRIPNLTFPGLRPHLKTGGVRSRNCGILGNWSECRLTPARSMPDSGVLEERVRNEIGADWEPDWEIDLSIPRLACVTPTGPGKIRPGCCPFPPPHPLSPCSRSRTTRSAAHAANLLRTRQFR